MNYVLDLVVILIIIGCAAAGAKKGAVRMLITLAGYAAAVAAAIFVSNVASDYVYENYVRTAVVSALEAKAESLDEEYLSADKLNKVLEENGVAFSDEMLLDFAENREQYSEIMQDEKLRDSIKTIFTEYCSSLTEALDGIVPEEIIEEAERYLEENNAETDRMLSLITQSKDNLIKIIEAEIVKPVMMKAVRFVLFAVTFAAVMLIVSVISYVARIIRKIPVVNSADSFLGTMFGVLQGLLYTAVLNLGASAFIRFTSDANKYLNTEIISESYVFEILYNATFYLIALILK